MKIERRFSTGADALAADAGKLIGYAARFNSWSETLGDFREKIAPGAFSKTLQEQDVRALFNHNTDFVLGRMSAGTLELAEDGDGLRMQLAPPETQLVNDMVMEPVRRGDISGMSFGFQTIRDHWESGQDGIAERTLLEVRLHEVSVVTFPAYPETSVSARALGLQLGLDTDQIMRIITRHNAGQEIGPEDVATIKRAIDRLQAIKAPGQVAHADESTQEYNHARLHTLRRKLELCLID